MNAMIIFVLGPILMLDMLGRKEIKNLITRFCTYIGGNLVTWCSQKRKIIPCPSTEAKY